MVGWVRHKLPVGYDIPVEAYVPGNTHHDPHKTKLLRELDRPEMLVLRTSGVLSMPIDEDRTALSTLAAQPFYPPSTPTLVLPPIGGRNSTSSLNLAGVEENNSEGKSMQITRMESTGSINNLAPMLSNSPLKIGMNSLSSIQSSTKLLTVAEGRRSRPITRGTSVLSREGSRQGSSRWSNRGRLSSLHRFSTTSMSNESEEGGTLGEGMFGMDDEESNRIAGLYANQAAVMKKMSRKDANAYLEKILGTHRVAVEEGRTWMTGLKEKERVGGGGSGGGVSRSRKSDGGEKGRRTSRQEGDRVGSRRFSSSSRRSSRRSSRAVTTGDQTAFSSPTHTPVHTPIQGRLHSSSAFSNNEEVTLTKNTRGSVLKVHIEDGLTDQDKLSVLSPLSTSILSPNKECPTLEYSPDPYDPLINEIHLPRQQVPATVVAGKVFQRRVLPITSRIGSTHRQNPDSIPPTIIISNLEFSNTVEVLPAPS